MNPVRLAFPARATLATQLFGYAPWSRAAAGLALAGGSCAALAVAWSIWQIQQDTRTAHSAAGALQFQAVARVPSNGAKKTPLTAQHMRDWNLVTRQLNTPWASLLDALETSTPEDIALVAIEPDAARGNVRLQVEAKTLDTLLAYAQALKSGGPFQDVMLLKHETNEQDATRPMRLSLDVRLGSPGAGR